MNSIIEKVAKSGKYIFCIPLVVFGLGHFANGHAMAGMVPVPGGVFWVYFTGAAMLAAAVAIITDLKGLGSLAAFLVGLLILIYVITIHIPAYINTADAMAKMTPFMAILKDLGLVGGAWVIAGTLKK